VGYRYDEGTFLDSHGRRFFYRVWRAQRARAVAVLFHALGLHSGRYAWLCEEVAGRGVSCFAVDLYGHGLSSGPRGGSLEGLLSSGEKFLQLAASRCPGRRVVALGHGSGAVVALHSMERLGLEGGVVALSPLHEVLHLLRRRARLVLLSLLNLRVEVRHRPLRDARRADSLLKLLDDNLVFRRVPARVVLGLAKLVGASRRGCRVLVLESEELPNSPLLRQLLPGEREVTFDPSRDEIPIDGILDALL